MVEFEWNFHKGPDFIISESRFCKLGELRGDCWRKAMGLSDFSRMFSEIICDYSNRLGIVYARDGLTIAITPTQINESLDYRGDNNWIGIQKKVDGSYNFCGSNEIPCSIEKEHIRPSVTRSVMEMVSRI